MSSITITPDGRVSFIWSDELAALREIGDCSIRRASHVEPTTDGRWTADMAPSGGPVLGPFDLRGDALKAEVQWLADNLGF